MSKKIVIKKGTEETLIQDDLAQELEIYLEPDSKLIFADLQSLNAKNPESLNRRIQIEKGATLTWIMEVHGGSVKNKIETFLNGEGAHAEILGLMCGRNKDKIEIASHTQHNVPNTTANILIKGTADDESQILFRGMIKIAKKAQQTNSYMANNNLLLSKKARADSIPKLEIEADDVKASHGATIGQVDKDQVFYLKTRGFSEKDAEQILIRGFYEDIFNRVPVEEIRERMRHNLGQKGEADGISL